MRSAVYALLTAAVAGCSCGGSVCTGEACKVGEPPQVFIVAPSNVVGPKFTVTVNVSGCARVEQLQLEHNKFLIKTASFKGANTAIDVVPGDLATLYASLGIAADLIINARAICDDGRNNRSPPVGLKFFPVQSSIPPAAGQAIIMPDSFVAEGGVNGAPVTFIGCANTGNGFALVRMNQAGEVVTFNNQLPLGCNYYANISDKVAGGLRWLFQPGEGVFAFDQNLNVTGGMLADTLAIVAPSPDGDALVWDQMSATQHNLKRVTRTGNMLNAFVWDSSIGGIVDGQPAFDQSLGIALVPTWRVNLGDNVGNQTIQYVNYANGTVTGELFLVRQRFPALELAKPPQVAFSPDARTIFVPVPIQGNPNQSGVIACGTQGGGTGCAQRWQTGPLDGIVRFLIPFAQGSKVAAISTNQVWFIDNSQGATGGAVLNPGGRPTTVSGQLTVTAVQPGLGSDFFLLAGSPFPTEIIAVDAPQNGEVFRYSTEGGSGTAQTAITVSVDDSGQSWLRVGPNQVKPLSLTEYRNVRGPTP